MRRPRTSRAKAKSGTCAQKFYSEIVGVKRRKRQGCFVYSPWVCAVIMLHQCATTNAFTDIPTFARGNSFGEFYAKDKDIIEANEAFAIPKHIAFICDGNSRWATKFGLPASAGHAAGANGLLNCLKTLKKAGVQYCTMYGFSTENWKRDDKEIKDILAVIEQTALKFHHKAIQENIRVKILGDIYDPRVPLSLQKALCLLEEGTWSAAADVNDDTCFTVCIAINYGGRHDIVKASVNMAKQIIKGNLDPEKITESDFGAFLCTCGIPEPDLIVRTGGEKRISNFLLWDIAYSELFFTDVLWPDLNEKELNKILMWFGSRSRRFGGRKGQHEVEA